jgi:hypothetical protein
MEADKGTGRSDEGGGCEPTDPELEGALSALRASVPVRSEWRQHVLREVDALPRPGLRTGTARRWSVSPPAAIAAALAFTALGAAGTAGVLSLRSDRVDSHRPSIIPRPSSVRFALVAPGASRVSLVGDFNRWDASATPMRQLGDGRLWVVEVPLPPGRHVYAFVVDGDVTPDPSAPRAGEEDFGVPSSVVLVRSRGS